MEIPMKLFQIKPKDGAYMYGHYNMFLIAASSIPQALELVYQHACPERDFIPYYLRSSNLAIETLGTVELEKKGATILCVDYEGD